MSALRAKSGRSRDAAFPHDALKPRRLASETASFVTKLVLLSSLLALRKAWRRSLFGPNF